MKVHTQRVYRYRKKNFCEIEVAERISARGPSKKQENLEMRKKYIEEISNTFDLTTFYLTSKCYQKDTGRYSNIGRDRHGNQYFVLGQSWARLFIEVASKRREIFMVSNESELEALTNYLRSDGILEGPLRKTIGRIRPLLVRVFQKEMKSKKLLSSRGKRKENQL